MRTITPELTALLRSRFQAAGSGFATRLEVDAYVSTTSDPIDVNLAVGTVTDGGSTPHYVWDTPSNANDAGFLSARTESASGVHGAETDTRILQTDLGAAYTVSTMTVWAEDHDGNDPAWSTEYSTDGVTWLPVTGYVYANSGAIIGEINRQDISFDEVTARYFRIIDSVTFVGLGFTTNAQVWSWQIWGVITSATYITHTYHPKRVNLNRNLRMGPDQAEIELVNEDLHLGFGPISIFPTNSRCRAYQWFGDPANAVLTFTGVIDKIGDSRDPLTTALSCRSLAGPILVDQTFSSTGPQGADEDGHIRTEANGVYLSKEVDYIAGDILDRAGWPSADVDIADTSFVLDEFVIDDGASWWDTLARLVEFVGYTLWDDEDAVIHLKPIGSAAGVDDPLAADYAYEIGIA